MSITINGLECERLECEHCGNTSDLLSIKSLPMVLCECCVKYVSDEELGIEPMDKE